MGLRTFFNKKTTTKYLRTEASPIVKHSRITSLLILVTCLLLSFVALKLFHASALVPNEINYQGKITDINGVNVQDGYYDFRVQIYDSASGGTLLYGEDKTDIVVSKGIFNVKFSPNNTAVSSASTYVQICFNSSRSGSIDGYTGSADGIAACNTTSNDVFDKVFSPRKMLTSNPYSLMSKFLGSTNISGDTSGNLTVNGSATFGDTGADSLTFNASTISIPNNLNFDGNTFYIDASANRVGIGLNNPSFTLDVNGTVNGSGAATFGSTFNVTGNATFNGNVSLGDASSDDIAINGLLISSLLAKTDNIYSLGSATYRWKDLFVGPSSLHVQSTAGETTSARDWTVGIQTTAGATQGNLTIKEANNTYLSIATNGYVGINTQAPQAYLNITTSGSNDAVLVNGNSPTFITSVGGTGSDQGFTVEATDDGGYIMGGYSPSWGAGGDDITVIKYSSSGNVEWTKVIGGTGADRLFSIRKTSDGGYILSGSTDSYGAGLLDGYLIKLSYSGTVEWFRTVGTANNDGFQDAIQGSDGGYIAVGGSNSDGYIVKYDAGLNVSWTKILSGGNTDTLKTVIQTSDGSYFIAGNQFSYPTNAHNTYWGIKLDNAGTIAWQNAYYTNLTELVGEALVSAVQMPDGSFVLTGSTNAIGAGDQDAYVIRISSTGSLLSTRSFGYSTTDNIQGANGTGDGGLIMTGYTNNSGNFDHYIVKLDSSLNVSWSRIVGGTGSDVGTDIVQTADGGYAFIGRTSSPGWTAGSADILIGKLDASGNCASCTGISSLAAPTTSSGGTSQSWSPTVTSSGTAGVYSAYTVSNSINAFNTIATANNSSSGLQLTAGGKLGIGLTTPAERLHVNGNILLGDASTTTSQYRIYVPGGSSTVNGGNGRSLLLTAGSSAATAGARGGDLILRPGLANSPASANGNILLADLGGNVGIGTTNPDYRLTIGGNGRTGSGTVAVNGSTVTGTGTAFLTEVTAGDSLRINGIDFTVTSIASDTSLSVTDFTTPNIAAGQSYTIHKGMIRAADSLLGNSFLVTARGNVGLGNNVTIAQAAQANLYINRVSRNTGFGNSLRMFTAHTFDSSTSSFFPDVMYINNTMTGVDGTNASSGMTSFNLMSYRNESAGNRANLGYIKSISNQYGNFGGSDVNPNTNNVYGYIGALRVGFGTVTTAYDIYLSPKVGTGAVTTHYGVYQDEPNALNVFKGKTAIGHAAPVGVLDVRGGSSFFQGSHDSFSNSTTWSNPTSGSNGLYISYDSTNNIGRISTVSPGSAFRPLTMQTDSFMVTTGTGSTTERFKIDNTGLVSMSLITQRSERLCHSGSNVATLQYVNIGDCTVAGVDFAEMFGTKDPTIQAADIVALDELTPIEEGVYENGVGYASKVSVKKAGKNDIAIGIVSTNPYTEVLGKDMYKPEENPRPIALNGRVPVKVNTENGVIRKGDFITVSSTPGVGAKAVGPSFIVAKALEDFLNPDPVVVGYIVAQVMNFHYSGTSTEASTNWNLSDSALRTSYNVAIDGDISAGNATFSTISTRILTINAGKLTIDETGKLTTLGGIQTNSLVAAGISVTDAIIKTLRVDKLSVNPNPADGDPTVGSAVIPAGEQIINVLNKNITQNARVFITITSNDGDVIFVTEKTDGVGFSAKLKSTSTQDVKFDYWIVGE